MYSVFLTGICEHYGTTKRSQTTPNFTCISPTNHWSGSLNCHRPRIPAKFWNGSTNSFNSTRMLYQLLSSDRGPFVPHRPCSLRGGIIPLEVATMSYMLLDSSHSFSACLPVKNLRDTRAWRDLFSDTPVLTTLEARIQSLCLLQAQQARDSNRARRLDLPTLEHTTILFASKVLNLPALSQGTKIHYEKELHERQ